MKKYRSSPIYLKFFNLIALVQKGQNCILLTLIHSERPKLFSERPKLHSEKPKFYTFKPNALRKAKIIYLLILMHSERTKLYTILAFLSALGLKVCFFECIRIKKYTILAYTSLAFLSALGLKIYNFGLSEYNRVKMFLNDHARSSCKAGC